MGTVQNFGFYEFCISSALHHLAIHRLGLICNNEKTSVLAQKNTYGHLLKFVNLHLITGAHCLSKRDPIWLPNFTFLISFVKASPVLNPSQNEENIAFFPVVLHLDRNIFHMSVINLRVMAKFHLRQLHSSYLNSSCSFLFTSCLKLLCTVLLCYCSTLGVAIFQCWRLKCL